MDLLRITQSVTPITPSGKRRTHHDMVACVQEEMEGEVRLKTQSPDRNIGMELMGITDV